MLELIFLEGARRGESIRLTFEKAWFGAQSTCDQVLSGPGVSAVHFSIVQSGGEYVVADNKSGARTFVNGLPIASPTAIRAGDQIVAGPNVLLVRATGDAPASYVFVADLLDSGAQFMEQDSILIGRKSTCEVQLNEPSVAPVHADLSLIDGALWITDRSSGAGVYVNGERVVSRRLTSGDVVFIQPFEIAIALFERRCVLSVRQRREASPLPAASGDAQPSASIASAPHWMRAKAPLWIPTSDLIPDRFLWQAVLWCVLGAFGWSGSLWFTHRTAPGPLAKAHSSVACGSCHVSFSGVAVAKCQSCHPDVSIRSAMASLHERQTLACTACHTEHRGSGFDLVANVSAGCLTSGCHTSIHQFEKHRLAMSKSPPASSAMLRGAAFEERFQAFGKTRGEPLHAKHVAILRRECGACHTNGDAFFRVSPDVMRARCIACHRSEILTVAIPQPVPFEVPFFNFRQNPGDPLHQKHNLALSGKCASCHTDGDPSIPVTRQSMRERCLDCHGFGPEATLERRCYSCHWEHRGRASAKVLTASRWEAAQHPARRNSASDFPALFLLPGLFGLIPIAFFGIAAGTWHYRQRRSLARIEAAVSIAPVSPRETENAQAPAPVPASPPVASQNLRPLIDLDRCVGCGSCVLACPFHVLEIVNEKAIAARLGDCTGFAACVAECPTEAIALVDGGPMQTIELPVYDHRLETNVPGLYLAGEAAGKALIKIAINQGKKAIESILADRPAPGDGCDVIIVGSGPAGTSAALAAIEAGLTVRVLEQGTMANTIRNYPRQKFVMAEPVVIPLYGPLWIGDSSKESLLERWREVVAATGLVIQEGEKVLHIRPGAGGFVVQSTKGEYRGARVILAIGRRGSPRRLGVSGEDLAKVVYNLLDIDAHQGKRICVVGGGDTALEAALGLSRPGLHNTVTLVHRGDSFPGARARNQKRIQTLAQEGVVTLLPQSNIVEIRDRTVLVRTPSQVQELANDLVFILIGGETQKAFLEACGIEFTRRSLG